MALIILTALTQHLGCILLLCTACIIQTLFCCIAGSLLSGMHATHSDRLNHLDLMSLWLLPAGNPVTAFMPARCSAASYSTFLQRVQQASAAGRFHRKPIGPIGASLSLQDENWALAVEVAVGSAFNTFVVHDFADQATLKVYLACPSSTVKSVDTGHHTIGCFTSS